MKGSVLEAYTQTKLTVCAFEDMFFKFRNNLAQVFCSRLKLIPTAIETSEDGDMIKIATETFGNGYKSKPT